jgi:hypothetical protein
VRISEFSAAVLLTQPNPHRRLATVRYPHDGFLAIIAVIGCANRARSASGALRGVF